MRKVFLSYITFATAISAVVFFMAVPVWAESKLELSVQDNKLSVDLVEADLTEVLKRLSEKAGIEITIGEGVSGTITLKFKDLPLQQGLEKIIGQSDYALEYVGEGLSKVKLVNKKGEAVADKAEDCGEIKYNKEARLLKFLDCEGKVIQEVKLDPCQAVVLPKGKERHARFAKEGKYVAVTSPTETKLNEKGKCAVIRGYRKIAFYDNSGRVLWKKNYGEERGIYREGDKYPAVFLANNGERTVVHTGVGIDAPGGDRIYVYDKQGNEVLNLPQPGEEKDLVGFFHVILSPNGRYLAVQRNATYNVYDLINKATWKTSKFDFVQSITNTGIAKFEDFKANKVFEIDLKEYLGRN